MAQRWSSMQHAVVCAMLSGDRLLLTYLNRRDRCQAVPCKVIRWRRGPQRTCRLDRRIQGYPGHVLINILLSNLRNEEARRAVSSTEQ